MFLMLSLHVSMWIAGSVKLPEKLDHHSDLIFSGDYMPGGRQNCMLSEVFGELIQLLMVSFFCNLFLHNNMLKQKTCPVKLPV